MLSTFTKAMLITVVLMSQLWGQHPQVFTSKPSVIKSAILPGWGEHSYNSSTRGYIFNGVEAALWIFAGAAYMSAVSHENDLFYFASEYGQISDPQHHSDVFMDRVSKYDNMDQYNAQMLRNRQWDRIYSADNGEYWDWESTEKRQEYFSIKTQRYLWRQRLTYSFGAIALNHLVSTMDALYLKRRQASFQLQPEFGNGSTGMRLNISF